MSEKIDLLSSMFPQVDRDIIIAILGQNNGDIDVCISQLLELLNLSSQQFYPQSDNKTTQANPYGDQLNKNKETKTINNQEILTKEQLTEMFADLHKALNEIKGEIQQKVDDVYEDIEDVVNQNQEMNNININTLVNNLKLQFKKNLNDLSSLYREKEKHNKEAYEAQNKVLATMVEEMKKRNSDLEKKRQLGSRVSHIFIANPSLKPEKIMIRSFDINNIADITLRHNKVQNEYNKFKLFSELYGNKDFGIIATTNDLNDVKKYVDHTVINPFTAIPPTQIPDFDISNIRNLNLSLQRIGWSNAHKWLLEMGENCFLPGCPLMAEVQRATSTYNNRLAAYQNSKKQHDDQVAKAIAVKFPSESFNRLVDQFNEFVNMI